MPWVGLQYVIVVFPDHTHVIVVFPDHTHLLISGISCIG